MSWMPPIQNTDGSPLTDLDHYELYWRAGSGTGYPNSVQVPASLSAYVIEGLPASGACYFVIAAMNAAGRASAFSNEAVKAIGSGGGEPGGSPPGKPSLAVTWSIPTPGAASVLLETVEPNTQSVDEWYLTVVGSVQIALSGQTCVDWIRKDGTPGGGGGTVVPTTPALGADNNDGNCARTFSVGPVTRARADFDATAFNGGNVTFQSATKPLVRFGSSWRVSF